MMTLQLDDEEFHALRRALDAYLEELRDEAAHTDARGLREGIWQDEKVLERLRARL
jgi:hypothetical protein